MDSVNYEAVNYEASGVSVAAANDVKQQFKGMVSARGLAHCTPVNQVGAFASLVEIDLKGYTNPVFVLKSEEPGSKQLLSLDNHRVEWIARDLINHLVNDIAVMGAVPCAVLDTIICGKFEKETILKLVGEISQACIENGCVLVGGETSEQPGVLPAGRYVLQASVLGVADRQKIVDGSRIKQGDALIALASNGLHTNGYSLVRKLMEARPAILEERVDGESFMDSLLKPHLSYAGTVKRLLERHSGDVHGMAHITGGGIHDNLIRILQSDGLRAEIDLSMIRIPGIFKVIKKYANITDEEMLATFNMGAGIIAAVEEARAGEILGTLGAGAYRIGQITQSGGSREVTFNQTLSWDR
ncbi:MAG: phosphoribosylformylglycinamidine cyclo-ligase [Peptococcaceae bacterium]|nr:phosphoribosylformylglycinamidine cyclo-ligase [Peptococcaceae bacterium]